jgi:hypothetical protein
LDSLDHVPALLAHLDVFKQASGQAVHPGKSSLLPIGYFPDDIPPLPAAVSGVPVVLAATTLGIRFQAGTAPAQPKSSWEELINSAETAFSRIAGLPLSAFGRAFAASSYGISRLLYAAEFVGLPPAAIIRRLDQATARLVDRRQTADSTERRFAGVAGRFLAGHPAVGGFGALPWIHHITARHAVWATRLLSSVTSAPWMKVAYLLLHSWGIGAGQRIPYTPLMHLMRDSRSGWNGGWDLPPPLLRLFDGLAALPPISRTNAGPLPWWRGALPLIDNPILATISTDGRLHPLLSPPQLTLVWDNRAPCVASLHRLVIALRQRDHSYPPAVAAKRVLYSWEEALDQAEALWALIPNDLRPADGGDWQPSGYSDPHIFEAARSLMPLLGWKLPDGTTVALPHLTVKDATALLTQALYQDRKQRHLQYVAAALGTAETQPVVSQGLQDLLTCLRTLWKMRWSNYYKETFWRLVLNGLPTSERMHLASSSQTGILVDCLCGAHQPGRQHHFWDCPAAQAVVQEIERCLGDGHHVARPHLWLLWVPTGAPACIWPVVCLAAVRAMWTARGLLMLPERRGGLHGTPEHQMHQVQGRAVAAFWSYLLDFTRLGKVPQSWRRRLGPASPFLHFHSPAGRLSINRPT